MPSTFSPQGQEANYSLRSQYAQMSRAADRTFEEPRRKMTQTISNVQEISRMQEKLYNEDLDSEELEK
ncbi:hypothetical protein Peur_015366 [Populus x canadensis]